MAIATHHFLYLRYSYLNGYPAFLHNCARGLHLAMTGSVGRTFDYTLKYSWQQAWGMGRQPQAYCKIDNSAMLDVAWDASVITDGLRIKATVAFDAGRLRGNNFGTMLSICYTGRLNLKKKVKTMRKNLLYIASVLFLFSFVSCQNNGPYRLDFRVWRVAEYSVNGQPQAATSSRPQHSLSPKQYSAGCGIY